MREQRCGCGFDPLRLLDIDVVALLHRADRALARILVMQSTQHVVQQALAQGAAANLDLLDPQRAHDFREYRDAPRKHGPTILAEPRQL